MLREYLHWTNLGLTKLMDVSISQIDFTKIHFLQNSHFGVKQHKTLKKSNSPKTLFCPKGTLIGPL